MSAKIVIVYWKGSVEILWNDALPSNVVNLVAAVFLSTSPGGQMSAKVVKSPCSTPSCCLMELKHWWTSWGSHLFINADC